MSRPPFTDSHVHFHDLENPKLHYSWLLPGGPDDPDHHRWTVDSFRPWVLECIAAFGVERSFFATNWPVDRLYSSYAEIVSGFSAAEQRALFSENANRIFRLP